MSVSEPRVVDAVDEVTLRRLRLWVKKGWINPVSNVDGLFFDDVDMARVRFIAELKKTFNFNDDAIAVVLSLVDQLHGLRGELRVIGPAIEKQPEKIRRQIVRTVQEAER